MKKHYLWIVTGINLDYPNDIVFIGILSTKELAEETKRNAEIVGYINVNIISTFENYVSY